MLRKTARGGTSPHDLKADHNRHVQHGNHHHHHLSPTILPISGIMELLYTDYLAAVFRKKSRKIKQHYLKIFQTIVSM